MPITEFEALFKPKKPYINVIIVVINVIIFMAGELINGAIIRGNTQLAPLYTYGALYGNAIINGEYFRFLTYMFLHGSVNHIFNNMLILYFMGNYCERSIGSFGFGALYFLSGISAGIGSILFHGLNSACIGASGAIFGIIGAVFCLILFDRKRSKITVRQILIFVFLSVYSGFTSQGVDNAAHITGLMVGFSICLIVWLFKRKKTMPDIK